MHFRLLSLSKKVGHFGPTPPPPPHQLVLIATIQGRAWGGGETVSKTAKKHCLSLLFLSLSLCLSYVVLCEVLLDDLLQEVDPCSHLVVGDVWHSDILHLKYQNNFSIKLVFFLFFCFGGTLHYPQFCWSAINSLCRGPGRESSQGPAHCDRQAL
jgi:hypothetical protein